MIRNITLVDTRLRVFESFQRQNQGLRGTDFKASECRGNNGSRWERVDYNSNGNLLASFEDWGLLEFAGYEETVVEIGGTETKVIITDSRCNEYENFEKVPLEISVYKQRVQRQCTAIRKVKTYRFNSYSDDRNQNIKTMARKIFNTKY